MLSPLPVNLSGNCLSGWARVNRIKMRDGNRTALYFDAAASRDGCIHAGFSRNLLVLSDRYVS
jgi:hypothetical protein